MKLWRRASGALKDQKSLLKASLTVRSTLRNPDIESAVIKATTHDESRVDYRSTQRVFAWVRISDDHLHRVLWAIADRMGRTRSWVVALKGLMLLHGVFCCKVPGIQEIGRLPFDLLNFKDKHSRHGKMSGLNAFVRAYYAFLDQKSSFIFLHSQEQKEQRMKKRMANLSGDGTIVEPEEKSMKRDLIWLLKLQGLLDTLLQIQPKSNQMINVLVLEAMDCVVVEIYDICSRICSGTATVLMSIYSAEKNDAKMALSILQKAKAHHEQLSIYFEFCREIGVVKGSECPKMEQIPEEGIRELEHIINGDSEQSKTDESPKEEEKSIIVVEHHKPNKIHHRNDSTSSLKTVITGDWEVFDEEPKKLNDQDVELIDLFSPPAKNNARVDRNMVELPDLIVF